MLLYAILKGYKFSVGKIIENSTLVTRLCILGGVEGDWEEEENCPRTSPLTLTGITKGPKNRGREREVEAVGEEEENIEINQIQIDSVAQEQEKGLNSASLILTMSLEVRQVHQEQAGISEPQGNDIELMEMLRAMRQEMWERDSRLKVQLQLKDEYMDIELKIRDQNLEESLMLRDEEWKGIWETRERELSEELRAREDAFLS